jgi:predicted ArsR family transcriptional regulator
VPAQIDGIRRHVYGALVELEVFATAKEVAGVLGCRPREAGNALTLLVDGGLAERADGDRAAGKPRRYRALPN